MIFTASQTRSAPHKSQIMSRAAPLPCATEALSQAATAKATTTTKMRLVSTTGC